MRRIPSLHEEMEELERLWRRQSEEFSRARKEAEEARIEEALESYEEGVR